MPKRSSKKREVKKARGSDINEVAASIVEVVASTDKGNDQTEGKNPAAVVLGRLGGLKGGKARADKLSADRRTEIAKKAANARWQKEKRSRDTAD